MYSKTQLRQRFRNLRQNLSLEQQQQAALEFSNQIIQSNLFQYQTFACYLAQDSELDMMPLIQQLWRHDKYVFLPVIKHDDENNSLVFKSYCSKTKLALNQYQIFEPLDSPIELIESIDVIFLPLVAFDQYCTRLGMGGGFYDRTLASLKYHQAKKPLLIGVGHACQKADAKLISDTWDVKLHAVITDKEQIGEL